MLRLKEKKGERAGSKRSVVCFPKRSERVFPKQSIVPDKGPQQQSGRFLSVAATLAPVQRRVLVFRDFLGARADLHLLVRRERSDGGAGGSSPEFIRRIASPTRFFRPCPSTHTPHVTRWLGRDSANRTAFAWRFFPFCFIFILPTLLFCSLAVFVVPPEKKQLCGFSGVSLIQE